MDLNVFIWIADVIASCQTYEQLLTCESWLKKLSLDSYEHLTLRKTIEAKKSLLAGRFAC